MDPVFAVVAGRAAAWIKLGTIQVQKATHTMTYLSELIAPKPTSLSLSLSLSLLSPLPSTPAGPTFLPPLSSVYC
jgi:hypothetical protein